MRLVGLPGWVIDNETSVRQEVAPFVRTTMARRWEATRRCCQAAMKMLAFHPARERALQYRDPVPPSAVAALGRLRRESRGD